MQVFVPTCLCCGVNISEDESSRYQIEALIPHFHQKVKQLILEDIALLEKACMGPVDEEESVLFLRSLLCFFYQTNLRKGKDPRMRPISSRFMGLLQSDATIWPTIMREWSLMVKLIHGGHNAFLHDELGLAHPLLSVVGSRPVAEYILSQPELRDSTADTLKEMSSLMLTSSFSKNIGEFRVSFQTVFYMFVGVLDHWCGKFLKHKLAGAGPSKHYFVARVGISKSFMSDALWQITGLLEACNAASDLLD